jgi:hypothetical protein
MLHLVLMAIAGAAINVSGSDVTWNFTMNPDGSGKVVVTSLLPPSPPEAVAEKGAEEIMRMEFLRGMLFRTGGVDSWADVSMDKNAEGLPAEAAASATAGPAAAAGSAKAGRLQFKGTAYFKDVTKVHIGPSRDGNLAWAKDEKGSITLSATAFALGEPAATPTAEKPTLTEEEIAKRMADLRQKFKERRESSAANLRRVKLDLIYHLPGTVTEVKGFTKTDDGLLHWTVFGEKLFEAYEKAMADDAFLRKCVVDGKLPIAEVMQKEIPTTLSARMTGELKPQFDYEAEVKAAKEKRSEMLKGLNLPGPPEKDKAIETSTTKKTITEIFPATTATAAK